VVAGARVDVAGHLVGGDRVHDEAGALHERAGGGERDVGEVGHGAHVGDPRPDRYSPGTMTRARTRISCAIIVIATSA
jgi:hypothetical protein